MSLTKYRNWSIRPTETEKETKKTQMNLFNYINNANNFDK